MPDPRARVRRPAWGADLGDPVRRRRKTTIPLVIQARNRNHGLFMGATLSSETTAAAVGQVGVVRRDPRAMLPFIGYHAGDYLRHWAEIGKHSTDPAKLPQFFQVNCFRRRADGGFLWPALAKVCN